MSDVEENVEDPPNAPHLDIWTTRELLNLVACVSRNGDKNWALISRTVKALPLDDNLDFDRYSPDNCAEQYAQLAQRLDEGGLFFESVEKQAEYLNTKMTEIHLQELQFSLQQTSHVYGQLTSFLELVEEGAFEDCCEDVDDVICESDCRHDYMYRSWLSMCNTGSISGVSKPDSLFLEGEPPAERSQEESSEAECASSVYATVSTLEDIIEEIEPIAGPSSEKQAISEEEDVLSSTPKETTLQPFFNPDNILKSASAGLFPFSAGPSSSLGAIPKHSSLGVGSPQKTSTVSSVTLSAPTLSKLLEMPPSVPGTLPPLPTFHIKTEPPSPHKALVKQLEATSPLKQSKGLVSSSSSAGVESASPQQDTSRPTASSCLAAYINKEISQSTEHKDESTTIEVSKDRPTVDTDSNVISEPETSSSELPDNQQSEHSDKISELFVEKESDPNIIESASSPEQLSTVMNIEQQNEPQIKTENPEIEVSDEGFTEMEIGQPEQEIIESSHSTSSNKDFNVSETCESPVNTETSSALLQPEPSVSAATEMLEVKESERGEISVASPTKPATPESESITKSPSLEDSTIAKNVSSDSQSCEFSFEEITFPIPKPAHEPTHSIRTSQFSHKTSIKRKRDSVKTVQSSIVSTTEENVENTSDTIAKPTKIPRIEETSNPELPSEKVSPISESEKNSDKNKAANESFIAFQVHDQSVGAEVELKDKNEKSHTVMESSSSEIEVCSDVPASFTPDITKIKQEVLDPDEVENTQTGVCITDLTGDREEKLQKTQDLPFSNSEVSSSSSSLQSAISEDTVAIGNITSHSESPASYQVSKDVKTANSSSFQDSVATDVPEVFIKKEIKQEVLDSEAESGASNSGFTTFFSPTSDPISETEQRTTSVSDVVIKVEDCDSEENPFPAPRRGRRSCRTQKSKVTSPKNTSPDQSVSKERSRAESASVSRTKSRADVSQLDIEKVKPVRRGRPRRKTLDKSSENIDKGQEDSSVDNDFGSNKKIQQITVKQEKKEKRTSRNNSGTVDRDDESTTSSQDSERFGFGNRKNAQKGNESRNKSDIEELSEKKNSEFSDDGENSLLKNISSAKPSPASTPASESSLAKGKESKGRWSPQSVDRTSRSTIVTPTTSDISDDTSDDSDISADTSTKQSKLKWNDLDSLHKYKTWKKSISIVWREAANHKYANVFAQKVTDDVAPGYHGVVTRPMDLSTIKKNIDNGTIKTTDEFRRDMMLMFNNAIMYNNCDHDVHTMAFEMQKDVHKQIQDYLATQLIVQDQNKESIVTSLRNVRQSKTQAKASNRLSSSKGN